MNKEAFDPLTRGVRQTVSRRASLLSLGAAAAGLGGPALAGGKKRGAGRCRKNVRKRCAAQGGQCRDLVTKRGDTDYLPCCEDLARCDGAGAALCFLET